MGCIVEIYDKNENFEGYIGWKYTKTGEISKRLVITDSIAYALLYNDNCLESLVSFAQNPTGKYKNKIIKLTWDGHGIDPNTIKPEDNLKKDNIKIKYAINKSITDNNTGETETIKLNKYTGHQTQKYNNITVVDYFVINGLRHAILSYTGRNMKYIIREDGEIFSLNNKGEWKLKAQHFRESGGVKNRARREAGKSGGSVYKCVSLWNNLSFLTHKLVKLYVTHEKSNSEYYSSNGTVDSIVKTGQHTHINENFYKGCMPVDFGKRCYKA